MTQTTTTYGRLMYRCICGTRVGERASTVERCSCYTSHVQKTVERPKSYRKPVHFRVMLDVEALRKANR